MARMVTVYTVPGKYRDSAETMHRICAGGLKDYTEAYYAWIDVVCDDISAEHNQRVWARGGRCG